MRQLSGADLFVVLGVAVLLWLGRKLLPEMQAPARVNPELPERTARQIWDLPRRPAFWVMVGLLALVALSLATFIWR